MSRKEQEKNKDTILEQDLKVGETGQEAVAVEDHPKDSSVVAEEETGKEPETVSAEAVRIASLEVEVSRLAKQLETEKDQFTRKLADTDNFRKRLIRERENAVQYANEKLLADLIPILDDFDRAISAGEKTTEVGAYAEGIHLIQKQLVEMLDRNWGLKVMANTVGKEFSPHDHEACMLEAGEQYAIETVIAELQKGYYLHDRVLRTAKVKVGKPL